MHRRGITGQRRRLCRTVSTGCGGSRFALPGCAMPGSSPIELTRLEIAALIAVVRLEGLAYGVSIHDDIESFLGVPISMAAVYAALERLARRRLLRTIRSAPLAMQGGRSKRLYEVTGTTRIFLEAEQAHSRHLWQALPASFSRGNRGT